MKDRLAALKDEYTSLNVMLADPGVVNDTKRYREITKRHSELAPMIELIEEYDSLSGVVSESREIIESNEDREIKQMAHADLDRAQKRLLEIEKKIKLMLLPKDPNDKKNAIVEIRAGTGGEEAALFAANLLSMYAKYTELQGLKFELLSTNETALGGYKEVIFSVEGPGSYGKMKFESGIHRVQRVPNTEASGRIHTSAVSAAVMPERDEVEVDISPDDIKVEVCKASGAGGQHVNTTESAVRIVHLPTGVEVQCQDERSQHKNKDKAMKILRSRVKDKMDSEEKTRADSERKAQVGTGDRSEKIRTYNFPQNRVTDHRIGLTSYNLESVMEGRLDEFIEKLTSDFNQKLMANE